MYRIHQTLGTDYGWFGHIPLTKWNIFLVSSISFLAIFADYDKLVVLKNVLNMLKETLDLNYSNNVGIINILIDLLQVRNTMLFPESVLLYDNNAIRSYSSVETDRNPSNWK